MGFEVAALLAKKFATSPPRARFQGEIVEAAIAGQKTLLLTPLTYMNASGASVLATRDFYKIENENLLVVCDDFALPLAKLRIRVQIEAPDSFGCASAGSMPDRCKLEVTIEFGENTRGCGVYHNRPAICRLLDKD